MSTTMTSFNQDHQNATAATSAARGGTPASAAPTSAGRTIDADGTTARRGTARIRSSTTSKDGISWECSNLLHFEDISKEVEDDDDSSVSSDESSSVDGDNAPMNRTRSSSSSRRTHAVNNDLANAFSSGLTMRRTSSVESFQQKIIHKHMSSGNITRVSSLHASSSNGNGSSSLRSFLSFGSGPDAAGGVALRTATGTATSGTTGAGSNANFDYQRGNGIGSSQSRRNANATSAGRALLDRHN